MFLDHDSPLLQPAAPDADAATGSPPLPRLEPEPAVETAPERIIELVFERPGSLGIEFKELAAPFVVEQVHSTGLAYGKDLQKGDRLIQVAGDEVGEAKWDDLVKKLTPRPVKVAFERPRDADLPAQGLGFGQIWSAASGFGLGKVGSAGLELTNKVSAGLDLGSQITGAAGAAALNLLGGGEEELARLREQVKTMKAAAPESELQLELNRLQAEMKSQLEASKQQQQALNEAKQNAAIESQTLRQEVEDAKQATAKAKSDLETLQLELQAARANGAESATLAQELSEAKQAAAQARSDLETLQLDLQAARANGAESATLAQELCEARQAAAQAKSDLESLQLELQAARANGAESATLAQELSEAKQAAAQAKSDLETLQLDLQAARANGAESATLAQELSEAKQAAAQAKSDLETLQLELQAARANGAESATLAQELSEARQAAAQATSDLESLQLELQAARANGAESATLAQELSEAKQAAAQAKFDLESLQLELQAARANGAESATLAQELGEAKQAAAQAKCDLESLQLELQAARANGAESATLAQELSEAKQAAAQAKCDLETLQLSAQSMESSCTSLKQQLEASIQSESETKAKLEQTLQGLPDPNQVATLEQQLQGSKEALTVLQRELHESQQLNRELRANAELDAHSLELESEVQALRAEVQRLQEEAGSSREPQQPETIEVLFALPGPLGLEFQAQQAPYIIAKIHDSGVAINLGINEGDELISVADEPVDHANWEDLVRKLSKRPVVGKFRRPAVSDSAGATTKLWSSVNSMGAQLLTAARGSGSDASAAENERLRSELLSAQELLKLKDSQLIDSESRIKQKEEALHVALRASGGTAGAGTAGIAAELAEEKSRLQQQLQHFESQLREAQRQVAQRTEESLRYRASYEEEARQKEEQRQTSISLQDRCNSLMKQFESLSATCQNLTMDSQQKAGLEGQVAELLRMNAQWQHAHSSLNAESESMRQRLMQVDELQLEVRRLEPFEAAVRDMETRLQETEQSLDEHRHALIEAQQLRSHDSGTVQRLQLEMESLQESSESQVSQLEAELMESSSAKVRLQREKDDLQRRMEELLQKQQETSEAAEDLTSLRLENKKLHQELAMAQEEQKSLNGVVERCLAKMEMDSRERPFLVDKRMVTQMLAAYLEQSNHPKAQHEILTKMADLLGFSTSEREQVGLSQKRKGPLSDDPVNLSELTDRFVDFLMEESEAG